MSKTEPNSETFNTVEYIAYLKKFHQEGPHLGNQYLEDTPLQQYIKLFLPQDVLQYAENRPRGLVELGQQAVEGMKDAADDCEYNPPRLMKHNAFGKTGNHVVVGWGWKAQRQYAANYHIVGSAYQPNPNYGQHKRFVQCIKNYIYQPSSGFYGCPLAMTDGCAYVLKSLLDSEKSLDPYVRKKVQYTYNRLTSDDPNQFFVSGQWMTEKRGGTDVRNTTETIAIQYKSNKYRLYGYKFFCSAADCDVTLALARIIDPNKKYQPDEIMKLPVSMFLIKLRNKKGQDNGLEYQVLKDKLGTKQVPTAEMVLNGSKALLVSPEGKGIKYIVQMLQTTRLYNAATAVGIMRRCVALVRDYMTRRSVFGKMLMDQPMQVKVLNDMEVTLRGNLIFYLKISDLFTKVQENIATKDESNIARIGSPLLKLFTTKELQIITSECMEAFGGIGYMENSKIPVYFRDGQVLPIWEGTTNVMAHDFHRAISQRSNPVSSLSNYIKNLLEKASQLPNQNQRFTIILKELTQSYEELLTDIKNILQNQKDYSQYYEYFMRDISIGASRIFSGALLLEVYLNSGSEDDSEVFMRWVKIKPLYAPDKDMDVKRNKQIALDQSQDGKIRGSGDKDERGILRPML